MYMTLVEKYNEMRWQNYKQLINDFYLPLLDHLDTPSNSMEVYTPSAMLHGLGWCRIGLGC